MIYTLVKEKDVIDASLNLTDALNTLFPKPIIQLEVEEEL